MILLYINNIEFMKQLIYYLDHTNVKYTTDLNNDYEYILIAELTPKIITFAKENYQKGKKIIFVSYLEEENISFYYHKNSKKSKQYFKNLHEILEISSKVLVHFESTRNTILEKKELPVIIIPREIPIIHINKNNKEIYNKYKIGRRKKKILIVDEDYKNIEKLNSLSTNYSKYQFLYLGYKPDYLLNEKQRKLIHSLPKNIIFIKYIDFNIFSDLCKVSNLVIFLENHKVNMNYIDTTLLFKKQLLIRENYLLEDLFINSKNVYTFKNKEELLLKFKKIITERVADLTDNGYLLIKDHTYDEIIKKYNAYLI